MLKEGTILDARIISVPSSTKNQTGTRDPEMHQTEKGNEWHFGMKMHIGTGAQLGLTHSFTTTAANVHDLNVSDQLLHGAEEVGSCYRGIEKREAHRDLAVDWRVTMQPGQRR